MCCIHLAEPLSVENETVVTLGAVLNTGADLPPPADSTVDTVADCWAGTRTAAHVTRLTAVHRTHAHAHTHTRTDLYAIRHNAAVSVTRQLSILFVCLFAWGFTALSAQIGYIAP